MIYLPGTYLTVWSYLFDNRSSAAVVTLALFAALGLMAAMLFGLSRLQRHETVMLWLAVTVSGALLLLLPILGWMALLTAWLIAREWPRNRAEAQRIITLPGADDPVLTLSRQRTLGITTPLIDHSPRGSADDAAGPDSPGHAPAVEFPSSSSDDEHAVDRAA